MSLITPQLTIAEWVGVAGRLANCELIASQKTGQSLVDSRRTIR